MVYTQDWYLYNDIILPPENSTLDDIISTHALTKVCWKPDNLRRKNLQLLVAKSRFAVIYTLNDRYNSYAATRVGGGGLIRMTATAPQSAEPYLKYVRLQDTVIQGALFILFPDILL